MRKENRDNIRESIKNLLSLEAAPSWQEVVAFYSLVTYVDTFNPEQIVTKSLAELENEIKPGSYRYFEKSLYLLARHGFIEIMTPSSISEKPRNILHGERWKSARQKLSERGRTPKSAGEILLFYLCSTVKDSLRQRRREDLRDILKFHIIPVKLQRLKAALAS